MKYNKELFNRFLTKKVAIALRTQEEWNKFMELLEKETDLVWESGNTPTELNYWEDYKEETAITNNFKHSDLDYRGLGYGDVSTYKSFVYEIIEFKELVKDDEINLADKLRFLADRWEDGKDFCIESEKYSLNKGELRVVRTGFISGIQINFLKDFNLKLAPQWEFTEEEKTILKNISEEWQWIARDEDGEVIIYKNKPSKSSNAWFGGADYVMLYMFKLEFETIKWLDEEPCEFRKYL